MFELIVAISKNKGIGFQNNLPWNCKKELNIFKQKTEGCVLVVGTNTLKTLPFLSKRDVYCLSRYRLSLVENSRNKFTEHFKFDLRDGFPLLTTKKMFIRGIIEEFLFFMRGDTDSSLLSAKNVKIWEFNCTFQNKKKKKLDLKITYL